MTHLARRPLVRIAGALIAVAAATAAITSCTPDTAPVPSAEPVAAADCADGDALARELEGGSTWTMCWRVDPKRGLVLEDIRFAPVGADPILLIGELALAQLEVPYDSGERTTYDITEAGFGATKMQTLTGTECLGDRLAADIPNLGDGTLGETETRKVLCSEVVDGGLGYRSSDGGVLQAGRRSEWQLSTISKVGWYEYVSLYSFGSDGVIRARLGATGDISPVDFTDHDHGSPVGQGDTAYAASHSHNAVWRIHWALDDPGNLAVQQYDATDTGQTGSESAVVTGTLTTLEHPATAAWANRRWWRILAPDVLNTDGHPISYQIDLEHTDSFSFTTETGTGYDVAFTNDDPCQIYAAVNRALCGDTVTDYVTADQDSALTDVVSWVAVGFHHVVRDEDQSPMDVHWQGFTLLPRDLTAQRIDIPDDRQDLNGVPDNTWTQEYEELQH